MELKAIKKGVLVQYFRSKGQSSKPMASLDTQFALMRQNFQVLQQRWGLLKPTLIRDIQESSLQNTREFAHLCSLYSRHIRSKMEVGSTCLARSFNLLTVCTNLHYLISELYQTLAHVQTAKGRLNTWQYAQWLKQCLRDLLEALFRCEIHHSKVSIRRRHNPSISTIRFDCTYVCWIDKLVDELKEVFMAARSELASTSARHVCLELEIGIGNFLSADAEEEDQHCAGNFSKLLPTVLLVLDYLGLEDRHAYDMEDRAQQVVVVFISKAKMEAIEDRVRSLDIAELQKFYDWNGVDMGLYRHREGSRACVLVRSRYEREFLLPHSQIA